jgi:hypothetical protein
MPRLRLVEVRGVGTSNERVWMEATDDLDLGNYFLIDTTYDEDGTLSNKWRHIFEFKSKWVEKGEFVCLYSKAGEDQTDFTTDTGATYHKIFWGLGERIWNNTGDRAHLIYSPRDQRQSVKVPKAN